MNRSYITKALFSAAISTLITPCLAQEYLEEVVVTASKVDVQLREIAASVSIINNQEIELRGYQTVADLLRTQPGVAVSNSGGQGKQTSIRIRGEESYRTLVVIDGIDVSDPTGTQMGPQSQHLMTAGDIEKIEIMRGPQGFMYGADAGGVINIMTKSGGQGFDGELSMEAGRYNTRAINGYVSAGSDTGDAFVSLSDNRTNGFDLSEGDEPDGYKNQTLHTKFGLNVSDEVKVQLILRDASAVNEYDTCGFGDSASNDCIGEYEQTVGRVLLSYRSASALHQVAIQQSNIERGSFNKGVSDFATEGENQKVEYLGGISFNRNLSSTFGGDFTSQNVMTSDSNKYDRDQYGLFGELRANASESLYTSIGIRFDDNEDFGQHTSARLSAAYIQELSTQSAIKYRASYGNGFRAPSLSEIAYNNSRDYKMDPLKEEASSGYDIGIEFYMNNGFNTQITYFDQMIEDEIGFDLVAWTGYLQQEGISHSKGIEFGIEYPVMDKVTLFGNYTYNETLTRDDLQRIRRPKKLANIGARVSVLDERLNILANVRFSKDSVNEVYSVGRVPLDDYSVIDISVNYTLDSEAVVFARVENAADKHYQEVTGYNAAEAAFYVGIKTPL